MGHDYSKGMHWVGHPGSLHPVTDYGTVATAYDIENKVGVALSGARRVRVPRGRPGRSWSMSIPTANHDDIAHVEALLAGTLPSYRLVTAEAQTSNVLTPERSTLQDTSRPLALAGSWQLEGGRRSTFTRLNPNAAFGNAADVLIGPCPTPPVWTGRAVTVAVHLATARTAGARVTLQWLDAAGALLSVLGGNYVTGMDALRRSTVTGVPPAGTVACRLLVQYAEIIAQPQVTWTDAPIPEWSVGRGADRVVIDGFDHDTEFAVPGDYNLRRGDYSLSFMEVTP